MKRLIVLLGVAGVSLSAVFVRCLSSQEPQEKAAYQMYSK